MEHTLVSTYADMENRGIVIFNHKLKKRKAACTEDGFLCIDCSQLETEAEENTIAIHEDGHADNGRKAQLLERNYKGDKNAARKHCRPSYFFINSVVLIT